MSTTRASKFCSTCGRSFNWRASHGASVTEWESVKYCSSNCRGSKPNNKVDAGIERSFIQLMYNGGNIGKKVLCEEVQAHDGAEREDVKWRERYRRAARRLANVKMICSIEHDENSRGKWLQGDGKGPMRVELLKDKMQEVEGILHSQDTNKTTTSSPPSPS